MSNTREQLLMHKVISYIKSGFRVLGSVLGIVAAAKFNSPSLALAFAGLFIAEVFGIIEEMVVD